MHAIPPPAFSIGIKQCRRICTMSRYLTLNASWPASSVLQLGFPGPPYCGVTSAFAAGAAQSCWLQILPYMVIRCSLPDSLLRPFLPCTTIGCFLQCRCTCEFMDRLKYEERPRWENEVAVRQESVTLACAVLNKYFVYHWFECWMTLGACAKNSFVLLSDFYLLAIISRNLWWLFITSDIHIVKCDGNVHVERLVVLCNVLQGIGFMLL